LCEYEHWRKDVEIHVVHNTGGESNTTDSVQTCSGSKPLTRARSCCHTDANTYEVLGGLWDIITEQSHDDASLGAAIDLDIEKDLAGDSLSADDSEDGKQKSGDDLHVDSCCGVVCGSGAMDEPLEMVQL